MNALDPEIRDLIASVKSTGRTQEQIAADAGLNYWWVNSFMQGRIQNPGWQKVESLRRMIQENSSQIETGASV